MKLAKKTSFKLGFLKMMKTLFDSIAYYAKHNPEREAVVTEHQTISYADLQVQVDRLAAELM